LAPSPPASCRCTQSPSQARSTAEVGTARDRYLEKRWHWPSTATFSRMGRITSSAFYAASLPTHPRIGPCPD